MTFRELLTLAEPDKISHIYTGGCYKCPNTYNYEGSTPDTCNGVKHKNCFACWNREIPLDKLRELYERYKLSGDVKIAEALKEAYYETRKKLQLEKEEACARITAETITNFEEEVLLAANPEPKIQDSGDRTEFETGAVRDRRLGKGRCDLMPLDVVGDLMPNPNAREILHNIYEFQETGDVTFLRSCLFIFCEIYLHGGSITRDICTMLLEVAKHFEEGCAKYGENNWRKGIPVYCYIDSAIRHYLKYLRGDTDERHDRAFCWNIMCCIWTVEHMTQESSNEGEDKDANNG